MRPQNRERSVYEMTRTHLRGSHTLDLPYMRGKSGAMSIDPKQPIPLYYQLKTLLVEEILDGRYAPAGRLPDRARALQALSNQ